MCLSQVPGQNGVRADLRHCCSLPGLGQALRPLWCRAAISSSWTELVVQLPVWLLDGRGLRIKREQVALGLVWSVRTHLGLAELADVLEDGWRGRVLREGALPRQLALGNADVGRIRELWPAEGARQSGLTLSHAVDGLSLRWPGLIATIEVARSLACCRLVLVKARSL